MSFSQDLCSDLRIICAAAEGGCGIHFLGVGGVSMRSLFFLTRHFGFRCTGSDVGSPEFIEKLKDLGEFAYLGSRKSLPEGTALLVYSHAVPSDNSERVYAREHSIPEMNRARYLGALMRCYDERIGVSGSHGKSTATAMIAHLLKSAGKNPTVLSGAALSGSKEPYYIGALDYLVYEACEYRDSFLEFSPSIAVFLNMELDHPDYFKSEEQLAASFLAAISRSKKSIVNIDSPGLRALIPKVKESEVVTFGKSPDADYRYEVISTAPMDMRFSVSRRTKTLGELSLSMLGEFNISNATAAIAAALEAGIDFPSAREALSKFLPISRRLERIGKWRGATLYYDYAHHPTEIKASLGAVRSAANRRVCVIFRPHTFSRTEALWNDFKAAFSIADNLILTDIAAIREREIAGVSSERLAGECGAHYASSARDVVDILASILEREREACDVIIMGAADMSDIISQIFSDKKS